MSTVAPIQVTVANGAKLQSHQMVSNFTWWSQGNTFSTDARILQMPYYDLVLGMDWLEKYSPMWIHWKRRLLRFTHEGKRISLKGVKDELTTCPKIQPGNSEGCFGRAVWLSSFTSVRLSLQQLQTLFLSPFRNKWTTIVISFKNQICCHHQGTLTITAAWGEACQYQALSLFTGAKR